LVDGCCAKCEELKRLWCFTPAWNGWVAYAEQSEEGLSDWERNRRANPVRRGINTPQERVAENRLARSATRDAAPQMFAKASNSGTCSICLNDEVQLVKFSDMCSHRFCRACLDRCATCHHDLCPMCRAPKTAPIAEESEAGSSGRLEARMLLELVGRHAGLDHFG
jgi:hypothetical protein